MLIKLEQTKQMLAGKHKAIDDWLNARQRLLIEYTHLAGLTPSRSKHRSLPNNKTLLNFCELLVDYVSAGHFEIYHHVVNAVEKSSGETLRLVRQIYPQISTSTELSLEFNDKYCHADEMQLLLLDDDLNQLGPILEERFNLEDRLIKLLHIVERLSGRST